MAEKNSNEMKLTPDPQKNEDVMNKASDTKLKKEEKVIQKSSEREIEEDENDEEDNESEEDQEDSKNDSDSDLSDLEYMCKICSKKFSGFVPLRQHEKSGKHSKAILKKKREKMLQKKLTTGEEVLEESDDHLFFIKKPYGVCQLCEKQFSGPESYELHLKSKSHKRKLMEKDFLDHVKEKGKITNELLQKYIKEKLSAMKSDSNEKDSYDDYQVLLGSLQADLTSKNSEDNDSDEEQAEEYNCKICEKVFSGFVPYSQHIISKVHAKTVKRRAAISEMMHKSQESVQNNNAPSSRGAKDLSTLEVDDDVITCTLCSMAFSGPDNAMAHLKSRGHAKKLKAKMWKFSRNRSSRSFCSDTGSEDSLPSRKESLISDKLEEVDSDDNISTKATTSESKKLDMTKITQENVADGGEVVDARNVSLQQKEEVLFYDKYKEYKKIMKESDNLL